MTLLAPMSQIGLNPAIPFQGALKRDALGADVKRMRVPELRIGQVVRCNILGDHGSMRAWALFKAAGCPDLPTSRYSCILIELALGQAERYSLASQGSVL